ncbi:hypothetical protein FE393_18745 [Xenorhabdus sp. psl]|nr:hypothetical protein [Xenorhabdus sp. psl]
MEKTQVGVVSFGDNSTLFRIGGVDVSPKVPSQAGDNHHIYTYTATVLDSDGKPAVNQKISNVKWSKNIQSEWLVWKPSNGDITTNEKGELTATLASHAEVKNIMVSLSIEKQPPVKANQTVSFTPLYVIEGGLVTDIEPKNTKTLPVGESFTFKALLTDNSTYIPQRNTTLPVVNWRLEQGTSGKPLDASQMANITFTNSGKTTDSEGYFTATLTSKAATKDITASIQIVDTKHTWIPSSYPVSFTDNPKDHKLKVTIVGVNDNHPDTAERMKTVGDTFDYIATLEDAGGNKLKNKTIHWTVNKEASKGVIFKTPQTTQTDKSGEARVTITSKDEVNKAPFVVVTASTDNNVNHSDDGPVMFKWPQLDQIKIDPPTPSVEPLGGRYTLSSVITRTTSFPPKGTPFGEEIKFKWRFKEPTFTKGLSLLPAEEVNVGADGALKVQLISDPSITPATDVIVCLYIVNIGPISGDTCSKPINFKKP